MVNIIPELVQDTHVMHNILHQLGEHLIARAVSRYEGDDNDEVILVFNREALFRLGNTLIQYINTTSGQKSS